MCWNAPASLASFIVGTIINISVLLYFKTPIITSICIIWQWVLMMQISEYFIWKGQDKGQKNSQLTLGTQAALVFNVTQPLVAFLCLMMISKVKMSFKIVASVVILFYVSFMLLNLNRQKEYNALSPTLKCEHISLQWWDDIKNSGYLYTIVLLVIILLLLRPYNLCLFITSYLIITLVISSIFYSCGDASMWCWLVVPFPIFFGIYYKQCFRK
jgi:hypothetical protein